MDKVHFLCKANLSRLGEEAIFSNERKSALAIFSNAQKTTHRESRKMKKQGNMFQTKEQGKSPETDHNKIEIKDLPKEEFKAIVIKLLTKFRIAKHTQSKNFNEEIKHMKITK